MYTISWSEIDAWRQCPFKWRLAYAERWTEPEVSAPLARGSLWHECLEKHYRIIQQTGSLATAMDTVSAWIDTMMDLNDPARSTDPQRSMEQQTMMELIRWMYNGYVQMWQADDREWSEITMIEEKLDLPLIPGIVNIKCRLDLLYKDLFGYNWLVDHKSGRNLPSKRETDLDDQFALYAWILRQLGHNVFGVIHNAARTQATKITTEHPTRFLDERFSRIKMVRSDVELDTMAEEIRSTALDIVAAYNNLDASETLVTPRHPDPDRCKWRCGFTSPCLIGRSTEPSRTRLMLKDLGFTQYQPALTAGAPVW